ncbi:MAG: GvpL/GvpF family gas vesicle protein [bacterium]|nr:GvpL/GvpF family gas vesicle protein [bacterium]
MTDSPAEAAELGIYLYCLARPECLALVQGSAESDLYGVDERYPVTTLAQPEDGVVAVIGQVDPAEFSEQNLQTLDWLGPRAQRHEAVVERIMDVSPVLPVKFGTMFRSRASLKEFLDRHHKDIEQALDKLRDKAEWSVKGYLVEEDARTIIAAEDTGVQSRRAALSPSPSPGLRYLQQKQLDAVIEAALRAWVARVTHDLHDVLVHHADASAALRCHASAVTGRTERMVFNGGFLLAPAALADFRAALSGLQQAHQRTGLTLELRGPWPPYNFCPTLSEGKP